MGRPEEASGALSKQGDDVPPPPYQESSDATSSQPLHQQVRSTQNANFSAAQPQQQAYINRQFPGKFSMYSQSGGFGTTYYLGEHGSHPLYIVKTHTGWSGSPDVVLHSGPSESSPPLAGVSANTLSRSATVELPPLPGSGRTAAEEPLAFSGFSHGTFTFSIEVGSVGRRESFEWRHSHGNEVDSLGGSSSGWKLVRLATDAPGGQGKGSHFVGGGPQSSDAKEVVAVWSNARMSMSKLFNFQFLGSGVTGALGERWAVMAVITALRIWDKERKARSAAAA
ncbi:hypothetical protein PFICI_07177 [Pestalotiopsis fici W106-1]|uniref:Uncharacterized protein n=1 Tax=Pestalotiopsis fici (strain W106-1 / CGMCC3.15140) TaxID=1229662 RepID=W3X7Z4_PESFW|nr:uncharacterized protein PFICI_07177 [Pestalotiopsis fici W106-1]ETS82175.1 hypothetical protein PFICI_07177 [Pestalotiopsis fici W106-1]